MLKDVETWFRPPSSPQDSVERLLNFGHLCTVICPICSMLHCCQILLRRLEHVSNISLALRCLGFVLRHVLPSTRNLLQCQYVPRPIWFASCCNCDPLRWGEWMQIWAAKLYTMPHDGHDGHVFKCILYISVFLHLKKNQTCPCHPFMLQRFNLLALFAHECPLRASLGRLDWSSCSLTAIKHDFKHDH